SAIAQSRAMHARPHVARALFDRSLVLSALGRDDEAAASRGEAVELAESIGLVVGGLAAAVAR
ncbi:MAG: hypothetical protein AB7U39_19315, partial [Ilumatobacteraceae bacterium]